MEIEESSEKSSSKEKKNFKKYFRIEVFFWIETHEFFLITFKSYIDLNKKLCFVQVSEKSAKKSSKYEHFFF